MNGWRTAVFAAIACAPALGQTSSVALSAGASFGEAYGNATAGYTAGCYAEDGEGSQIYGTLTIDLPGEGNGGCGTVAQDQPTFSCTSEYFVKPGQYTVSAWYSGFSGTNGNGAACTVPSAVASQTVTVPYGGTTTTLAQAAPAELQAGQTLTLLVDFTGDVPEFAVGQPGPTENVDLYYGTQALASGVLVNQPNYYCENCYTATINASSTGIAPGIYLLTVGYPGDSVYSASRSTAFSITILPAQMATNTALTVTPNPTVKVQLTTVSVTVTPSGITVPGGTVSLLAGSTSIGTITLSNGSGTLTVPANISTGTYPVQAIYGGDAYNIASTSSPVAVTVDAQTSTTTTVTVSPATIVAGATAQLTATVTPTISNVVPTGTVTVSADGMAIATLALNNGTASETVSTAGIAPGPYSVVGKYNGSTLATASTSPTEKVTIDAASSVSLLASPNPVEQGGVTTLTATVKNSTGGLVTSGTVTFSYAGSTLGSANVGSNGQASLPIGTNSFAEGSYVISAAFSGSGSVPASTGTVNLTVN